MEAARNRAGGGFVLPESEESWPEVFFVPLYVAAAGLLWRRHWLGSVLAFVAGGGIIYVGDHLSRVHQAS